MRCQKCGNEMVQEQGIWRCLKCNWKWPNKQRLSSKSKTSIDSIKNLKKEVAYLKKELAYFVNLKEYYEHRAKTFKINKIYSFPQKRESVNSVKSEPQVYKKNVQP